MVEKHLYNRQDEVAKRLTRTSADEMRELMYAHGDTVAGTWRSIACRSDTAALLLSHGWTLKEYATACKMWRSGYMFTKYHCMLYEFTSQLDDKKI